MRFIDFASTIKDALRFSVKKDTFAFYFIISVIEMLIFMAVINSNTLTALVAAVASGSTASSLTLGVQILVAVIIIALIDIFASALLTYKFKSNSSVKSCVDVVKSKYLWLIAVVIIVGVISAAVGTIVLLPFAAAGAEASTAALTTIFIVAMIINWVFIFIYQEIMINNSGIVSTLRNSWSVFKKQWPNTLVTLVIALLLSLVIVTIFALPSIYTTLGGDLSKLSSLGNGISDAASVLFGGFAPMAVLSAIILLIGATIAKLVSIGVTTGAYLKIKRR
ncbi:MAG: hypothetical protein ABIG30_03150 [Candidatus Aenigmatarchaeota archaeon]